MLLVVDIGNTHIVLGGYDGDELKFVSRISTNMRKTVDEYASKLRSVLTLHGASSQTIDGCIISSVVPPISATMKEAIKLVYEVDPIIVSPGIKTGLNLYVDNPASVGADLICASVGAKTRYKMPAAIIDMGTATKIIILDESGTFIGVTISPGVEIGLKRSPAEQRNCRRLTLAKSLYFLAKTQLSVCARGWFSAVRQW